MNEIQTSITREVTVPRPFFRSDAYPFYSIIYPHAEHYRGRTYVAFQHTRMDPYVMAFDHEQGTWSNAVRVASNPIGDHDTHGNPALWVDDKGRIHLIYGCHGGPALHVRSANPQDITLWEPLPDAAPKCTYPQISRFGNGDLLFFFRSGTHSIKEQHHGPWGFKISRDGGNTWGTFHRVTNGQGDIYASSAIGPDDTLHVCMVWESPPRIGRQNVYYVCLDRAGKPRNAAGADLPMPFGLADLDERRCKIYCTGGDQTTYTPTMAFSADGTLWVAFPSVGTREFICG
ncbi:MAG: BNR-4 repeat-containing protein, partial [Anaerolineae bacterium]|nr:BNR-4 repeat-containing protein [Anaerolineae bacterium]